MIFVTLGSQKFQMNRLLEKLDELKEKGIIQDDIVAQCGASDYQVKNYTSLPFVDKEQFALNMEKADLVISHGGTGALVTALKKGKKVIAVPRLAKYGEHVDDHQLQICEVFSSKNYLSVCYEMDELENYYKNIQDTKFNTFVSNNALFIEDIDNYLSSI